MALIARCRPLHHLRVSGPIKLVGPHPPSSFASFTCTSIPITSCDCVCPGLLIELGPSAARTSSTSVVLSGPCPRFPKNPVSRWIDENIVEHRVTRHSGIRAITHVHPGGEKDPLPVPLRHLQLAIRRIVRFLCGNNTPQHRATAQPPLVVELPSAKTAEMKDATSAYL
jgi:hypothetical protein